MTIVSTLHRQALALLQEMIAIPSFSREEEGTADLIARFLQTHQVETHRVQHNVFAANKHFSPAKPTILLNSHHDTVRPNEGYTLNPFTPQIRDGKLYGLGSNDAGGCLVALLAAFLHFYNRPDLRFNLVIAATAEEEISGSGGIEALLKSRPWAQALDKSSIHGAIVGEPTSLHMAVAERGLLVLDITTQGKSGHAARKEGKNAIYAAMKDIQWFQEFRFDKVSKLLGAVDQTVTVIETENKAHNVVPASCHFVVDIRVNECYRLEEVLATVQKHVAGIVSPRSLRLQPSLIAQDHALVQSGLSLGLSCYGSPTISDRALMPFPALKIGPGESARSHTADEYIYTEELNQGIDTYIQLLEGVLNPATT